MTAAIEIMILIMGAYLSAYVLYTIVLLGANYLIKDSRGPALPCRSRFAVIIPAHNEELLISRLLGSVNSQDYPRGLYRAVVVADNCTDSTAKVARKFGALVLERTDALRRGKGHAIAWAIEEISLEDFDAILIVDADSVMQSDALKELDLELQSGRNAIQCYNGVCNPDDSWFTKLLDVSRTIGNEMYHPGRQKLGLSSYLMGNGMCISTALLRRTGWKAFTVGEDWEYYAMLIEQGEKVYFSKGARVYHQESSTLKQATSQRMRWSGGRFYIAWKYGPRLLFKGVMEGSLVKMDASLPLILPNPSLAFNLSFVMLFLSMAPLLQGGDRIFAVWAGALVAIQLLTFAIGVMHTKNRADRMLSLFAAPLFLVWKMGIDIAAAAGMGRKKWVRTERRR